MIVQKAFKYRFFPTDSQKRQLARTFGCARFVWNQGLELRSKTYEETKKSRSYAQTTNALTQWKKEPEKAFLKEVSSVVLQQSLRNLDLARRYMRATRSDAGKVNAYEIRAVIGHSA